MVVQVVEFLSGGTKLERFLPKAQGNYRILRVVVVVRLSKIVNNKKN